jgi:general secretion pathway protein J
MSRVRGFTLIELLVAVAIVAVIGVIALTGLDTFIKQEKIAEAKAERLEEVQFAIRTLVQDLSEVQPRVTRDETGLSTVPSFVADPNRQFALEFSRGGWTNPVGLPRGSVLRVAYDVEEDKLVRFYWPVEDRTLATPIGRNEILTGVKEMTMIFYDANGDTSAEWPPLDSTGRGSRPPTERPRAVEIRLDLEDLGEIWRFVETSS